MKQHQKAIQLKKIMIFLVVFYIFSAVAFYFLSGDQLKLRESRGNIIMPAAEKATVELVEGNVIEQSFSPKIQRLKSVSVMLSTYYRENDCQITMELLNGIDNSVLMHKDFDAKGLTDGEIITMSVKKEPIENLYNAPLILRITSNGTHGNAVTPMMNQSALKEQMTLTINSEPINGTLCFSVMGEDYIWTGLHYWEFVLLFFVLIVVFLYSTYCNWLKGKKTILVTLILTMKKYKFLIKQLVNRDFKTKYKRSILGVLWSFLNPLLNMLVLYVVFSNLFRFDIPHYPVYLLCGIVMFNFFSEACSMALGSIIGNAGLITKVYVPKYIYPLTRILSSMVNLLISMLPLLVVTFFSGIIPTKAYALIPFILVCIGIFCLGLGMLLSSAMVFFRDIQFLWGIISTIWMYLTPIFYPENILPTNVAWLLKVNPLYYFIKFLRICVIDGISPEPIVYVQCFLFAIIMLLVGGIVFKKTQDKFVLYL